MFAVFGDTLTPPRSPFKLVAEVHVLGPALRKTANSNDIRQVSPLLLTVVNQKLPLLLPQGPFYAAFSRK